MPKSDEGGACLSPAKKQRDLAVNIYFDEVYESQLVT